MYDKQKEELKKKKKRLFFSFILERATLTNPSNLLI